MKYGPPVIIEGIFSIGVVYHSTSNCTVIGSISRHLNNDESGFFIDTKDSFSLNPIFSDVIGVSEFREHFRDILDYRVEDFRRFRGRNDP